MRLYEFKQVINESGNIWKDVDATIRINKKDVIPTVKFLESVTGLPLVDNMLGSTGRAITSGDLDLAVDEKSITKEELGKKLAAWADEHDPHAYVKKSGISVHFRCPILGNPANDYCQVDFMFLAHIKFAKWAMIPQVDSNYKNNARIILLASVAASLGLRYNATTGLINRETNKLIRGGQDPNIIARTLFGPKASAQNAASVESILATLEKDPLKDEKLKDAIPTLKKMGIELNHE